MAKRPIGDLLAAVDVIDVLTVTVAEHEATIVRIVERLAEIEARLDALPSRVAP